MNRYIFKIKYINKKGNIIKTNVIAKNKEDIYKRFKDNEIISISIIKKIKTAGLNDNLIISFLRQILSVLKSGGNIGEAIRIGAKSNNKIFNPIFNDILNAFKNGKDFYTALTENRVIGSKFILSFIRYGEKSGNLENAIEKAIAYIEKRNIFIVKIIGILIYPTIVIGLMIFILSFLFSFILPNIFQIYNDTGINIGFITQIILNISIFMKKYHVFWFVLLSLPIVMLYIYKKNYIIINILKDFPFFNKIIRYYHASYISSAMAALLDSGINIKEAIEILGDEGLLSDKYNTILDTIKSGYPISKAFEVLNIFDHFNLETLRVAEGYGTLKQAFFSIGEFYEREVEITINLSIKVLEPLIIILVGIIIGGIVITIFSPIFNIVGELR